MPERERPPQPPDQTSHDQPTVEGLKRELFGRDEPPEEYRELIANGSKFFVHLDTEYANFFAATVLSKKAMKPWRRAVEEDATADDITEFGRLIKDRMTGKSVIDLGCGNGYFLMRLAMIFDAKRYVGVDQNNVTDAQKHREGLEEYKLCDDMLGFVSKMKDGVGNLTYYIGGVDRDESEAGWKSEEGNRYVEALVKEIARTMQKGDTLIFGPSTHMYVDLEKFGFKHVTGKQAEGSGNADFGGINVYEKE